MNTVKKRVTTQFDLTNNILNNLSQFDITPTAKLVLLYLTSCYNPKHAEIFPKQKTIADKLGVSEVSVTRAICELHKEGLVLSERKISNRYVLTSRIVSEQPINLIDDKQQNDIKENIKMTSSYIHEQKKETKKEQTLKSGENVYTGDDFILYEYAKKKAKYSVDALIKKIKENGGDKKIISEYKKRKNVTQIAQRSYKETQELLEQFRGLKNTTAEPTQSWQELGEKIKALRKQS